MFYAKKGLKPSYTHTLKEILVSVFLDSIHSKAWISTFESRLRIQSVIESDLMKQVVLKVKLTPLFDFILQIWCSFFNDIHGVVNKLGEDVG